MVSLGFLTRFLTQFLTLTLTLTLTLNPNPNQAHKREKEANKSTAAAGVRLTLNPGKGIADVVGWLSSPPQGAAGGGGGGGAAAGGGDGGGAGGAALGGGAGAPGAWRCDRLLQCEGRAVHTNPEAADGAGNVLAAALTASPGLGGVARRVGLPLSCTNISGPGATPTQMQGLAHTKLMLHAALDPKVPLGGRNGASGSCKARLEKRVGAARRPSPGPTRTSHWEARHYRARATSSGVPSYRAGLWRRKKKKENTRRRDYSDE